MNTSSKNKSGNSNSKLKGIVKRKNRQNILKKLFNMEFVEERDIDRQIDMMMMDLLDRMVIVDFETRKKNKCTKNTEKIKAKNSRKSQEKNIQKFSKKSSKNSENCYKHDSSTCEEKLSIFQNFKFTSTKMEKFEAKCEVMKTKEKTVLKAEKKLASQQKKAVNNVNKEKPILQFLKSKTFFHNIY